MLQLNRKIWRVHCAIILLYGSGGCSDGGCWVNLCPRNIKGARYTCVPYIRCTLKDSMWSKVIWSPSNGDLIIRSWLWHIKLQNIIFNSKSLAGDSGNSACTLVGGLNSAAGNKPLACRFIVDCCRYHCRFYNNQR